MAYTQHIVNVEGAIWHDSRYLMVIRGAGEDHASGDLSMIGGTLDPVDESSEDVLVATLKREIREEVGVAIGMAVYVRSTIFQIPDVPPVYNFIFLCQYTSGDPYPVDPVEVASVHWLTPDEIMAHPAAQPWTKENIQYCERKRKDIGW
ncbi:MAG: NUDIX hydrolase [Aggregatilineales bacterium]